MDILTIVGVTAINFFSVFLQGCTGFGYAITAMFLMPFILPYKESMFIGTIVIVFMAVQMAVYLRKHINFKVVLVPILFCLLGIWPGVYLIRTLDEKIVRLIFGIFLICLVPYFYFTSDPKFKINLKANFINGSIVGFIAGIATGMFNMTGPFFTMYYFGCCEDSLSLKGTMEFSYVFTGLASVVMYAIYTPLTPQLSIEAVLSSIACLVAGFLGLKVYKKLNKKIVRYIFMGILPILGLILIFR
ncbi:MAG: sulfite exporter TauE/SafE family protein [Eubacteriales bacterium]